MTDILRQRRLVSTTVIRKVNNTLGKTIMLLAIVYLTVLQVYVYQLCFYYCAVIMELTHYGLSYFCPYLLALLDLLCQGFQ